MCTQQPEFTNATNEKLVLMIVTNENNQEFSLVDKYTKILKHYWSSIAYPLNLKLRTEYILKPGQGLCVHFFQEEIREWLR